MSAIIDLEGFRFECDELVEGVAVNPKLPGSFSDTANEARPARHRAWWGVPYIETDTDDHPAFVAHWQGTVRFDVRCLDGGAWDRPTCWGMFGTMEEALQCTKTGPRWLMNLVQPGGTKP